MLVKSLEAYATSYLEAIRLEVHTDWLLADIIAEFMDNCIGGGAKPKEIRDMMVSLSTQVGQSGHSALTMIAKGKVAKVFPKDSGVRHLDVAFSIYLTCVKTADPYGWLNKALEKDWKVKQLRVAIHEASGRPAKRDTIQAIKKHLLFFGLGTEEQVATLTKLSHSREPEDALTLRGMRDILGGLRRMMNGKSYLEDAPPVLHDLVREIERWRMR